MLTKSTIRLDAPWTERNGRFAPLKAVVFAGLFLPALWIAWLALSGALEPKVVTEMIHLTGKWAIRLLLLSLLVTPLMRGARYPKFVAVRRMIGVAAFAYVTAHLFLYVVDQAFDLPHVASEIARRFYLTIGFVAWLGLAALAATSTDAMIRRLGPRWRTLHSLVYGIGVLGLLHFMIQAKADVTEPVIMTGFFLILMLFRILLKQGAKPVIAAVVATLLATPLTALIEAGWYALVRHIPFSAVWEANFSLDDGLRPAAYVLAAGAAFTLVAFVRRTPSLVWGRGLTATPALGAHRDERRAAAASE